MPDSNVYRQTPVVWRKAGGFFWGKNDTAVEYIKRDEEKNIVKEKK